MKTAGKLSIFIFTLVVVAASANAQSPHEELQQMVEQLQKSPGDNALREKIIKLARTMKPSPAVPDAAIAFEGRARFAFEHAKSEGDFLAAAQEYEKAVAVAPWVLGYYADLCTIYGKAGKFEDARRHCGFYLTGLTDPAEITDVKRRIAGLEFGIEQTNSPQAREAALLQKVEGARFVSHTTFDQISFDEIYEIKGGTLYHSIRIYRIAQGVSLHGYTQPGEYSIARTPYRDGAFKLPFAEGQQGFHSFTIREDGLVLTRKSSNNTSSTYPRQDK